MKGTQSHDSVVAIGSLLILEPKKKGERVENGPSYNLGTNVEGDRLSRLPDDLTQKIFSLIGTKNAIQTSVLSSKWRFRRISLPVLDFSSEDFPCLPKFVQFVNNVLSRRNNQIDVATVKLRFHGEAGHVVVQRIMD
ncbi:putative leucine-rich repeat domain-like protein [Tanacetum coccineum]